MGLPADNPNATTDLITAEIKAAAGKDLAALPDLQPDDLTLFGTLVQYFCFMDLNLRRALETFHAAKMLPKEYEKLWPEHLPDAKLTEAVGVIIKGMPEDEKADCSTYVAAGDRQHAAQAKPRRTLCRQALRGLRCMRIREQEL